MQHKNILLHHTMKQIKTTMKMYSKDFYCNDKAISYNIEKLFIFVTSNKIYEKILKLHLFGFVSHLKMY